MELFFKGDPKEDDVLYYDSVTYIDGWQMNGWMNEWKAILFYDDWEVGDKAT